MENNHRKDEPEKANEVILEISNEEIKKQSITNNSNSVLKQRKNSNPELIEMDTLNYPPPISIQTPPSPENLPPKPPKIPSTTLIRRVSVVRSAFSKPKSRFQEPSCPNSLPNSPPKKGSTPVTPKTPFMASSPGGDEEEDDEEIFKKVENHVSPKERYYKKMKVFVGIEWILLICIWGFLITSLTVRTLQHSMIWGLEIWKWCVLVMVIVSGHLMMKWFIHVVVFLIEKNFLLKNKVLYFIFGVRKSVQVFLWLGLVLVTWVLLINRGVKRSEYTIRILNKISRGLIASLVGALIWMIKTLLVKLLATNFQSSRYFDRIQESLFHQYVLKALSRELVDVEMPGRSNSTGRLTLLGTNKGKGDVEQEVINMKKLNKMRQEKVSAWTMRGLIDVITTSGLSTISNEMDQLGHEIGEEKNDEITNEWEAKAAAIKIFKNVTKPRSNAKYIEIDDLMRFLTKEETDNVLPLFEGAAEIGKIKKSALKRWVVKVYHDRKSLAHSLNDTKTAVKQLNNIISAIVIIVIIIVWLLIMGIATIQVFIFISSQMLVAAFMFGNTAKQIFECIIFVFVMHPFDVGDRCVIDGVQMIVEEMNILTTVFLRFDSEKIYYPNSVLATKPISNFYRSPDMGDNVEFSVDISTSIESIGRLRLFLMASIKQVSRVNLILDGPNSFLMGSSSPTWQFSSIKNVILLNEKYIENKSQHWRPTHSIVVKEIENLNKMKMVLFVTHTMNHQNYTEKNFRRTELVLEMKKIFEDLQIKYHLLPQEILLSYVGSAANVPIGFGHQ